MIKKFTCIKISSLIVFCFLLPSIAFSQNGNIGFESGNTDGWVCGSGTYGDPHENRCNIQKLPFKVTFDSFCLNEDGDNSTNTPINVRHNRHTIMSEGTDPNSFNNISCVAPANLFPNNTNNYSFRLGNAVTADYNSDSLALTEGVSFQLRVDALNAQLTYMYSLYFCEPDQLLHLKVESPRFIVKITDTNDSLLKENYKEITTDYIGLKHGATNALGIWKYTDWIKVPLDLSPYIGQTLTITFMTSDCFVGQRGLLDTTRCRYMPGGHAAYAYLDLYTETVTRIASNKKNNSLWNFSQIR